MNPLRDWSEDEVKDFLSSYFSTIDADKDGKITLAELRVFTRKEYDGEKWSKQILARADADGK